MRFNIGSMDWQYKTFYLLYVGCRLGFHFFSKKTKQKKLHPANSHTQNSLNHQALKWILQFENFDCVQTVLAVIRNHSYLLFL
jgi:hypothetical protein